jgi:hypothetical protein
MILTYRKAIGKTVWHCCKNCSDWPTRNYTETQKRPVVHELCNECRIKEDEGSCEKSLAQT